MITTMPQLIEELEGARWFSALGRFPDRPGFIAIRSLGAWADPPTSATEQEVDIAERMDWLPTTFDQADPFESDGRGERVADQEPLRTDLLRAQRLVLESLRGLSREALLQVGPHGFWKAASGAAQYCTRKAAIEVAAGTPGRWSTLLRLYVQGFWPCGLLPTGEVVVL